MDDTTGEQVLFSGYATPRGGRILVLLVGVLGLFVALIGIVNVLKGKALWTVVGVGAGMLVAAFLLYVAFRKRVRVRSTPSGLVVTVGAMAFGPDPRWSASVCEGVTRSTRGRELGRHPVLQVVFFDAEGNAVVRITETRNMFQRAPVEWEWSEPLVARKQLGNIVGTIGLEELVAQLDEPPRLSRS